MSYTYPVVDTFLSWQGEGLRTGQQTLFIRFFGCNLHCAFCDEPLHKEPEKIIKFNSKELVVYCMKEFSSFFSIPRGRICFTGGEPLLHPLDTLLWDFLSSTLTKFQIETNGTQPVCLSGALKDLVHLTVSPKAASGFLVHPSVWEWATEVKLVCNSENIESIVSLFKTTFSDIISQKKIPVFIQPENQASEVNFDNLEACKDVALREGFHLSIQLHKLLKVA